MSGRLAQRQDFGVRRGVRAGNRRVPPTAGDLSADRYNGAHGHFIAAGLARQP
jgi:hypothetical protein